MLKILTAILLLFCLNAIGVEYEMDINYSDINHSWRTTGEDKARFDNTMIGVGGTAWLSDNWGFRVAHMEGGKVNPDEGYGQYSGWTLDQKSITSFEIIYKHRFFSDDLSIYGGVGHYEIPVPIYNAAGLLVKNDRDDDEGYFLGLNYSITDKWGIGGRFTMYSVIEDSEISLKEYTKGVSVSLNYSF